MGLLSAAMVGLMPACGSDGSKPTGGIVDDGGGATTSVGGSTSTGGGATNTAGTAGVGTSTGGTGTGSSTSPIGQPCLKDSDCGTAGLMCLLPSSTDFLGGGVPNGVCTMDCSADLTAVSASVTSVCAKIDPNAICLGVTNTLGYCWEACTTGAVPTTETKCHARHDMACADPQGLGTGFCKPTCRGDFDCAGRVCDLADGICTDPIDKARNLPSGAKCDPNAATDTCTGACIGVQEGDAAVASIGFCSGFCKLGEVGCGVDPTSKDPVESYCLFGTDANSDAGDLGFCAELCDCNDDCKDPDFICSTVTGLSAQVGRLGACGPKSGAPTTQPNGVACTTTTKPKPDAGKPATPATVDGGPDGG
ncbi:MAG TPA: hypothetical protein VH062_17610 [Polyangiaceae bacterium]|nr:hypothetical protein [Polyangiaceae bacterium]